MREEATVVELRPHTRLLHGMRRPANWLQLVRFGIVGTIGFAVNLAVYALLVHGLGVDYRLAAVLAWLIAVINNFMLNRHWTFDAGDGVVHFQAMRFPAFEGCQDKHFQMPAKFVAVNGLHRRLS